MEHEVGKELGSYQPSVEQLEDWDDELAEFYDAKLDEEMLAAGIPISKATTGRLFVGQVASWRLAR